MATMESMAPEVRAFVSSYGWHRTDPVPWAEMKVPLAQAKIGLVVTACMTMPEQLPFNAEAPDNDASLRIVPSGTDPATLVNTFPGQAFDHAGLAADANLLVPLDRLAEMAAAGRIGSVTPRTVSLCGHLPKPRRLILETAPRVADLFVDDGADAVLLVPA